MNLERIAAPGGRRPGLLALVLFASVALSPENAWAGPPFLTDDPEPVELRHWEFYAASQWSMERHAASGTCPHFEVNYGALPGLQLHAILPAVLSRPSGAAGEFGIGDIELGAKLRFVEEGKRRPQIGIFPLVTLPTGSEKRGLGAGAAQALLPVWVQKSLGPWTTYGGGGLRVASEGNAAVAGWLVQRSVSKMVAAGTEAYATFPFDGAGVQTQLNVGLVADFSERQHLLLSVGPSFGSDTRAQAYVGYLLTL